MQTFIVVLEYSSAVLLTGVDAARVPVCEHAYDLGTDALAGHAAGNSPRVGFPACQPAGTRRRRPPAAPSATPPCSA